MKKASVSCSALEQVWVYWSFILRKISDISGGSTMIPDLVSYTREEAVGVLTQNSLTEAPPVYVETTDASQVGQVLAQSPTSGTMAVLGAPVTLTIGIESQPYQGELALALPDSDQDQLLRVTLLIDGEEKTEYEGTITAGMQSVMIIPLSASEEGELECRVYLNGVLYSEETVLLY